jgi:hypothetical protein
MLGRLLKGLVFGFLIGGLMAGLLIKGLGLTTFVLASGGVPFVAYAAALVTGAVCGLVAGKPIWAEGAWIEGLLKAFFGALLGAGAMFLARKFGGLELSLESLHLGEGPIGQLPITTLPAIATVLSVFYELDNTDTPEPEGKKVRVPPKSAGGKQRVATGKAITEEAEGEEELAPSKKAQKH